MVPPAAGRNPRTPAAWGELAKVAAKMHSIYSPGYPFPDWSLQSLRRGELGDLTPETKVYYPSFEQPRLQQVKELTREREPVNIEMRREYDKEKLRKAFGYSEGAYGRAPQGELMPHIAIYCETPIRRQSAETESYMTMRVINAIGMGFDTKQQLDYQHFMGGDGLTPDKWEKLKDRMTWTWVFIFNCAKSQGLKRIYNCMVGGGYFAQFLNKHDIYSYEKLYNETFQPVRAKYSDIEVFDLREIFDLDKMLRPDNRQIMRESLLVNAWDPWSMVGNGNNRDDSLDGKMGRLSAMAVLCWTHTNPDMKFVPVDMP